MPYLNRKLQAVPTKALKTGLLDDKLKTYNIYFTLDGGILLLRFRQIFTQKSKSSLEK